MSEPESSLREDASESDEADRRRLDRSGELSESESRRDLRFGEELESESEDFERRRDLRFGDGEGEPCLPVSTSRAAVSRTALATCVEIKILRRVRAESSRQPPLHRRDASMAWRCASS